MSTVRKFLIALLGPVIAGFIAVLDDGHMSAVEGLQVAIMAAGAAGVWIAANTPSLVWAKTLISVTLTILNLLASYIVAGPITTAMWLNIGLQVLVTLGVYAVPNTVERRVAVA